MLLNDVNTYYRQSMNNTVGVSNIIDEVRLKMGIKVKLVHYKRLSEFCKNKELLVYGNLFTNKMNEILELKEALSSSAFLIKYINTINNNLDNIYKGWWSEILPLNQWRSYE